MCVSVQPTPQKLGESHWTRAHACCCRCRHQLSQWATFLGAAICGFLFFLGCLTCDEVVQDEGSDFKSWVQGFAHHIPIIGSKKQFMSCRFCNYGIRLEGLCSNQYCSHALPTDKGFLTHCPTGLKLEGREKKNVHVMHEAEITSLEKDMALDHVSEAKTDQAICDTSSFVNSSFTKTLRNLHSLEIPAQFVKQHSYNFQAKVVLQGPSGRFTAVHLTIDTSPIQDRVYFRGSEWRDFLLGNGFNVGYQLIISLVSKSTFIVRHSGAIDVNLHESVDRIEKSEIYQDMKRANLPERKVRPPARLVAVRHRRDSSETISSGLESPVNNAIAEKPSKSQLKSDIIYARGTDWKCQSTVAMLVGELRCPHFVAVINRSHLREWKSSSLSVPREFYKKYAEYFSEGANIFQGPNGRIMILKFSKNSMRFTSGWKAFHTQNNIKLGDVMLFSLPEPARWLIQVVERKLAEVPTGSDCDSSDLE